MRLFRYTGSEILITILVCGISHAVSAGDSSVSAATGVDQPLTASAEGQRVSGWRRTETGWVQTDDWTTSSSSTGETQATKLHPSLIAAFVVLVSIGGLLAFDPRFRRRRKRIVKSDRSLIQVWGGRLRRRADRYDCL